MPRTQRKKSPVSFIAGSSFSRATQKAPQTPPKEQIELATPEGRARAIKSRTLSYRIETLRPDPPKWKCPHGIRITEDEIRFEAQWKRKYHCPKEPPISFECIKCFGVCVHGLKLTPEEVNSGKRVSKSCPKCVGRFTNATSLAAYLEKQHLSKNYGISLTECELVTSYGLRITKSGKNFVQAGGSKETEQMDASNIEILETKDGVIAAQISTGQGDHSGYGPDDDYDFDGQKVDELGDPVSFTPGELLKAFEKVRTEETSEVFDSPEIEHEIQDTLSTEEPPTFHEDA